MKLYVANYKPTKTGKYMVTGVRYAKYGNEFKLLPVNTCMTKEEFTKGINKSKESGKTFPIVLELIFKKGVGAVIKDN